METKIKKIYVTVICTIEIIPIVIVMVHFSVCVTGLPSQ